LPNEKNSSSVTLLM